MSKHTQIRLLRGEVLEGRRLLAYSVAEAQFARVAPETPETIETSQYWYGATNADEIHEYTSGDRSLVVAVFDSGVDYTHPEIAMNIWINRNEFPPAFLDDVFLNDPADGDGVTTNNIVDSDNDGILTFFDLNDPINLSKTHNGENVVEDFNGNGFIDGGDLIWEGQNGPSLILDGNDNDSNGYEDDLIGQNFGFPHSDFFADDSYVVDGDLFRRIDPMDHVFSDGPHGTSVASIISARAGDADDNDGNDDDNIVGLTPKTRILPITVTGDLRSTITNNEPNNVYTRNINGDFDVVETGRDAVLDGLDYIRNLTQSGEQIVAINMSFNLDLMGFSDFTSNAHVDTEIRNVMSSEDMFFSIAAGNDGDDFNEEPWWPKSVKDIVDGNSPLPVPPPTAGELFIVAATGQNNNLWVSSNHSDDYVEIGAPGVDFEMPAFSPNYHTDSGTSMAAPQLSGAIAAIKAIDPSLSSTQAANYIRTTAIFEPAYSGEIELGRLNAGQAIEDAWNAYTQPFDPEDLNLDGAVDFADIDFLYAAIEWYSESGAAMIDAHTRLDFDGNGSLNHTMNETVFSGDLKNYLDSGGAIVNTVGDVNGDGMFTSSDIVAAFNSGEFEDSIEDNSSWTEGDWDGDGDFTQNDLDLAYIWGPYE